MSPLSTPGLTLSSFGSEGELNRPLVDSLYYYMMALSFSPC